MNNPGNSVLNEAGGSKEKKAGVFPIRYIAVLGFQPIVWHFSNGGDMFQSAISRYLVSNDFDRDEVCVDVDCFNPLYRGTWFPTLGYCARVRCDAGGFNPLYRGTWFPTYLQAVQDVTAIARVSIRYIAVLGFQLEGILLVPAGYSGFNPLYRGTWFPTGRKRRTGVTPSVSIRYIAVLGFQQATRKRQTYWRIQECFNPLYRGTWFPTFAQTIANMDNVRGFNPLYRGTWFPT